MLTKFHLDSTVALFYFRKGNKSDNKDSSTAVENEDECYVTAS